MKNKQWLELISEKRDEILEAGEQAFKDSIDNTHLTYTVEINQDGDVNTWYQSAGWNSMTMSSYNGSSLVLMTFCNQYFETNVPNDDYYAKLDEKEIEIEGIEDMGSCELMDYLSENHAEIIQECESDWIEAYKDNYAYEEVDSKLDRLIDMLEDTDDME